MENFPARGAAHSVEEVRSGLVIAGRIKRAVAYSDSVLGWAWTRYAASGRASWQCRLTPVRPVATSFRSITFAPKWNSSRIMTPEPSKSLAGLLVLALLALVRAGRWD